MLLLAVLVLLVAAPASARAGEPPGSAPLDSVRSLIERTRHGASRPAAADSARRGATQASNEVSVAAPADSAQRVPGTPFRLGASVAAAAARGLRPGEGNDWRGPCRFFGIESDATLTFAPARLARARFTVSSPSPAQITYVQDQLRAMGYHRRCRSDTPGSSDCDWTGATLVHLQASGVSLDATVTAPRAVIVPVARAVPPAAASPGAPTTPVRRPDVVPPAVLPPPVAPQPPATDTAPATDGAVIQEGVPEDVEPAPILPETLGVSLPGRPSRYAAARVLDEWRPLYPVAARRAGIQGRVWLLALVDTSGLVIEAEVVRGIPELNAAAIDGLRHWRLERRTWRGQPCRYRVEIPVTFRLY